MTAITQSLFQSIQRLNDSVLAGVDAGVMTSHAVSVIQALPFGAVARQFGGVSTGHQQDQEPHPQTAFHGRLWAWSHCRIASCASARLRLEHTGRTNPSG